MKIMFCIAAAAAVAAFALLVQLANTDPFSVYRLTAMSPKVAYAASTAVIDGQSQAESSAITWHVEGADAALAKEGALAICDAANEAIKAHPRYNVWCGKK